jgi:hypothetical protein
MQLGWKGRITGFITSGTTLRKNTDLMSNAGFDRDINFG